MRLKVNISGKGDKVVSLPGNDRLVGELLQEIAEAFSIEMEDIESLRFGYPPMKVSVDDDTLVRTVDDIGLSSGEKVGVTLVASASDKKASDEKASGIPESALADNQSSFVDSAGVTWVLQQHKVPDDNSCLFHAIAYCVYKDISLSYGLRERVAKEILADPGTYNEAILGKPVGEYVQWIQRRDSWGGGIEIAVLSRVLGVAVYVLDIDALKYEKFNEDTYDEFIVVLFNGVHYDAVESLEGHRTVFNVRTEEVLSNLVLACALEIARKLKQGGHAFNTHSARIVCNVCHQTFVGERDIARHAETTGHTDFGQAKGSS